MPTIRVDDEAFKGLQQLAEPFTDTPNDVIRRLLRKEGVLPPDASKSAARQRPEPEAVVHPGSKASTPQPVFESFLLHVLATKFKGSAHKHEVTAATVELMEKHGLITAKDHNLVSTGETRAANTIAWGRNALKDRGLISHTSPRGIWELTAEGMQAGLDAKLPV